MLIINKTKTWTFVRSFEFWGSGLPSHSNSHKSPRRNVSVYRPVLEWLLFEIVQISKLKLAYNALFNMSCVVIYAGDFCLLYSSCNVLFYIIYFVILYILMWCTQIGCKGTKNIWYIIAVPLKSNSVLWNHCKLVSYEEIWSQRIFFVTL